MSELNIAGNLDRISPVIVKFALDVDSLGGQAWIVGGMVRDWVLGVPSKDVDMEVTGLEQSELEALDGWKVEPAGQRFGVWLVRQNGVNHDTFEVALPQTRQRFGTGHNDEIALIDTSLTIVESLSRRDYTMNAMAVNVLTGEMEDPFNGCSDLENGILQAVNADNFGADPLRVLRGMQFCSRFNLTASPNTLASAQNWIDGFHTLSPDRVRVEWQKWANGQFPAAGIRFLVDCGWVIHFPAIAGLDGVRQDVRWHPEGDALEHTILALENVGGNPAVSFAVLLHDIGKAHTTILDDGHIASPGHADVSADMVPEFFRSAGWQFGNPTEFVQIVAAMVREHMWLASFQNVPTSRAIRRLSVRLSPASVDDWAVVCAADICGRGNPNADVSMVAAVVNRANEMEIVHNPPEPIVMGRHLMRMGVAPGPGMGDIIRQCFQAQLDGEFDNLDDGLQFAETIRAAT